MRLLAIGLVFVLAACQPVDPGVRGSPSPSPSHVAATRPFEDVVAEAARAAQEWQPEPQVVDVVADLADPHAPAYALTFVAPEADRLFVVRVEGDAVTTEQVTFASLSEALQPLPADAVAAVAPLPADSPPAAVVAAVGDACGAEASVDRVEYHTGVPYTWDGDRFVSPPTWDVDVRLGGTVVPFDLASRAPQRCPP